MYDDNNVFAKIIRGELPANKIYEDDFALAFHSIEPQANIHALVIPKGEWTDIYDFISSASAEIQTGFWQAVKNTADKLEVTEFKTIANTGPSAEQSVFHFHVHLLSGNIWGMEDK